MTAWRNLEGRRVGVWGTGVEGQATLLRLKAVGLEPFVVVSSSSGAVGPYQVVGLSEGGHERLRQCDVVIKSPGVSPYDDASRDVASAGALLTSGLELWLQDAPLDHVACITGTKGKSTTTAIAGALCRGLGGDVFIGGNLGTSPWHPSVQRADWYFIEVSSYQAHDIHTGSKVVAVTSLSQDHLIWHRGYEHYLMDKLSICRNSGVEVVIAPAGDPEIKAHLDLLGPSVTLVEDREPPAWAERLRLLGRHNMRNALLAQRILVALGVLGAEDSDALERAASSFEPLPSRLTIAGSIGGVDFIDDSLSTNALPTLAAVSSFPRRRIALLVGGFDRKIDYSPLALGLRSFADSMLVLTIPDNGPRIAQCLRDLAPDVAVREFETLSAATHAAYEWAKPDGVVLLSPAAPSFGEFADYAERASAFVDVMRLIAGRHP